MQKMKFKILLSALIILVVATTYCFAAAETPAGELTSSGDADALVSALTEGEGEHDESVHTTGEGEGESESEPEDPTANWIRNDLYKIDDTITVSQVVDGNAFLMGKNVKITSEIGGDLFVIADKLEIESPLIYSSIFAIANEITIKGKVYDVYATCNTFNVAAEGNILRDLRLTAQNLNISGVITRNAYVSVGNITFAENASQLILGNLNYSSTKQIDIPAGVVVGQTNFSQEEIKGSGNTIVSNIMSFIGAILLTAAVAFALIWLTPKFVEKVGDMSLSKSFVALGIGFLTPICLIILSIILILLQIGIPVFVCLVFLFILLAYIAKCITSIFFGKILVKKFNKEGKWDLVLYSSLVTAVLWIITLIPVVGALISFVAAVFGIGLTIANIFSANTKKEVKAEKKQNKSEN